MAPAKRTQTEADQEDSTRMGSGASSHGLNPSLKLLAYTVPSTPTYVLCNATVPAAVMHGLSPEPSADKDGLVVVDIAVDSGRVVGLQPSCGRRETQGLAPCVDVRRGMILPTFVDLHTHIDKGHTCDRSRNPTGGLGGADKSTAADLAHWNIDDVERRMEFSLRCAYANGTSALRTHLINLVPKQVDLTWRAFTALRRRWAGRVELQAVSLVVLSYFRDMETAVHLADTVKAAGGVLGCAVCCSESGGTDDDDWTTCNTDRMQLLDRIFRLASERDLMLDFHVDENGNPEARGLRCISEATIRHNYQGRVVCGHCCSLAKQPASELGKTLTMAKRAGIAVVSLPLVNEWTQDRDPLGKRTPRWRGITCLKELKAAGIPVAVASDNTRDQFYAYGDLDMLEVFRESVRLGHLDRPSMGSWPKMVTSVPAAAMGLRGHHGVICLGGRANLILFRGRNYGELLSRPQHDRVVLRDGVALTCGCPDYAELDSTASGRADLVSLDTNSAKTRTDEVSAAAELPAEAPSHVGASSSFAAAFGGASSTLVSRGNGKVAWATVTLSSALGIVVCIVACTTRVILTMGICLL